MDEKNFKIRHFDDEISVVELIPYLLSSKIRRLSNPKSSYKISHTTEASVVSTILEATISGIQYHIQYDIISDLVLLNTILDDDVVSQNGNIYIFDSVMNNDDRAGHTLHDQVVMSGRLLKLDWMFLTAFPSNVEALTTDRRRVFSKPLNPDDFRDRIFETIFSEGEN